MTKVLEGIRVLDITRYLAGPHCAALLADMGAEVIRVDKPGGEDDRLIGPFSSEGVPIATASVLRNKKSITLNLRTEEGRRILSELVKHIDVVVENYPLGVKERFGLDYESLRKSNPRIIAVSVTGFGTTGPYARELCFDPVAQAISGAMSYTGFPDGPPTRAGFPPIDMGTGSYAALGTVLALYHRERTGMGQAVDLALLDTAVSYVANNSVAAEYRFTEKPRERIGDHSYYNYSNCLPTKDGWVYISVISNTIWARLMTAIGKEDLIDDPRFGDDYQRFLHRELINEVVQPWLAQRTVAEVRHELSEARVPCGWVNTSADIADDPQIRAREMLVEVDFPGVGPVPVAGVPIKLSLTPGKVERPPARLGEHNEEIYCGLLGLDRDDLARLESQEII